MGLILAVVSIGVRRFCVKIEKPCYNAQCQ